MSAKIIAFDRARRGGTRVAPPSLRDVRQLAPWQVELLAGLVESLPR